MLKGRLELENFSGRTEAAVRQDMQATVLLANLESVLGEPAKAALNEAGGGPFAGRLMTRSFALSGLEDPAPRRAPGQQIAWSVVAPPIYSAEWFMLALVMTFINWPWGASSSSAA